MSFHLTKPHTVLVEPIRNTGYTDFGFYVLDNDSARTTMMVRVTKLGPDCTNAVLDRVYMTTVYRWVDFDFDNVTYHLMDERDLLAEIVGYDNKAIELADELESEAYPTCGK